MNPIRHVSPWRALAAMVCMAAACAPLNIDQTGSARPCSANTSCHTCAAVLQCGWCNGQCLEGNISGPTFTTCRDTWQFSSNMCMTSDCSTCTTTADCPIGQSCLRRRCDSVYGCYATGDPTASCPGIGGVISTCP